jgi:RecB family endonuclease NucS
MPAAAWLETAAATGRSADVTNPPVEVFQAVGRLSANPDFRRLVEWLERQKEVAVEGVLDASQEHRVLHKQGYALCMYDILRVFESANVALERHASAKP